MRAASVRFATRVTEWDCNEEEWAAALRAVPVRVCMCVCVCVCACARVRGQHPAVNTIAGVGGRGCDAVRVCGGSEGMMVSLRVA
jgi:hypothetical protein